MVNQNKFRRSEYKTNLTKGNNMINFLAHYRSESNKWQKNITTMFVELSDWDMKRQLVLGEVEIEGLVGINAYFSRAMSVHPDAVMRSLVWHTSKDLLAKCIASNHVEYREFRDPMLFVKDYDTGTTVYESNSPQDTITYLEIMLKGRRTYKEVKDVCNF